MVKVVVLKNTGLVVKPCDSHDVRLHQAAWQGLESGRSLDLSRLGVTLLAALLGQQHGVDVG